MNQYWIEYSDNRPWHPMSLWVHHLIEGNHSDGTAVYDPPLQDVVPGQGYPTFNIQYRDFVFKFASLAEIQECIDVLGEKLMPTTIQLSNKSNAPLGPNSHWLSRLPSKVLAWRYREAAVRYIENALSEFRKQLPL